MKHRFTLIVVSFLVLAVSGCKTTPSTPGGTSGGLPSASSGSAGSSSPASPAGSAGGQPSTSSGAEGGGESSTGEPSSADSSASDGGALPSGESSSGDGSEAGSQSQDGQTADSAATGSEAGSAGSAGQSIEVLDGQLDQSLEDFDDRVAGAGTESGEVDILDPTGMNTGGIAAGVPVFEEADIGSGDAGSGGTGASGVENSEIEQRASEGFEGADSQSDSSVAGVGGGGAGSYPAPDDVGDGQGDDIVLRQIREAAMNEPDQVLREKLWEEYRRIKGQQ